VKMILEAGESANTHTVVGKLREIKNEFKVTNLENICKIQKLSNYEKYVLQDNTKIVISSGADPVYKGGAIHNYMLYNSEYMGKYQPISSGNKVAWYYTLGAYLESFAFVPGDFPMEIDPPEVDYERQFETLIIKPLERILECIGIKGLTPSLIIDNAVW